MPVDKRILNLIITLIMFFILELFSVTLIRKNASLNDTFIIKKIFFLQSQIFHLGENIKDFFYLQSQNRDLLEENARLRTSLDSYIALHNAKDSLRTGSLDSSLIAYITTKGYKFIPVEIKYNSISKSQNFLIIDKGFEDGITEGMGIISSKGVIGYVENVDNRYSRVRSFLDINSAVGVKIKSNGTFGTLRWNGKNPRIATLTEIPIHTSVKLNDTIVTSGYSIKYPADIEVGTISAITVKDGVSFNMDIKLFENYNTLSYAYAVSIPDIESINYLKEGGEDE